MEMSGDVELEAPRARVWASLNDTDVLVRCIPGCESMTVDVDGRYRATVVSRVGPIKARFDGRVSLEDVDAPNGYTLVGEGAGGAAGFAKARIDVRLEEPAPGRTRLGWVMRAQIGGKLAQLGSRMIESTARKSAGEFFDTFRACVAEAEAAHAGAWTAERLGEAPAAAGAATQAGAVGAPAPAAADSRDIAARPGARTVSPALAVLRASVRAASGEQARRALEAGIVRVAVRDGIATVTLDRPDSRNAMTLDMWGGMPAIVAGLERDPAVRVVLLAGAGRDFCSGADIAEFGTVRATAAQASAYEIAVDACCDAIAECAKPTIAVLRGYCLGGGVHLAMSCDLRIAAPDAVLGIPAARLSIVYGVGGTRKLLALVGVSQAKRILYGGERLGAAEARAIGLVDEVVEAPVPRAEGGWLRRLLGGAPAAAPAPDPLERATAIARAWAANAPLSIAGAKYILNGLAIRDGGLDEDRAEALIERAAASDDYREGREAFAQRRSPDFQGR
jgi:enoyl-CoA hydratase/carnithine racemase/carbon monoxide dehydrogenase subunit G